MSWHQHQRMSSTTRRYTSEEYDNHGDSGDRASSRWRLATLGSSLGLAAGLSWWWQQRNRTAYAAAKGREQVRASSTTLENYSGTHSCSTDAYYEPESIAELEAFMQRCYEERRAVRPVGRALSPNGIGFSSAGMVNIGLCDRVLHVDKAKAQVRVEAGITVEKLTEELRQHGLTLQNFASIREQQLGGFTQVSAHGTGALIPPVDEQVVSMTLVTAGPLGTIELSRQQHAELFELAKVGLGALGVVSTLLLQCVPAHRLEEETRVYTRHELLGKHAELLRRNRHVRYMWMPYTEHVTVVTCNPVDEQHEAKTTPNVAPASSSNATEPLYRLLLERSADSVTLEQARRMTFAELRDRLLAIAPLEQAWVARINAAESEFWRRSQGKRIDVSDRVLGFDCGGQQWVLEVAFPTGKSLAEWNGNDMRFMQELLDAIEAAKLPAPGPIEQRWTATSSAAMSPASSAPGAHQDDQGVVTWVGIIMYLPPEDEKHRSAITAAFHEYGKLMMRIADKYGAAVHWAKLELPPTADEREQLRRKLAARYPTEAFGQARKLCDPEGLLGNELLDTLLPAADKPMVLVN